MWILVTYVEFSFLVRYEQIGDVVVVEVGSEEAQESSYFFAGEGDNENTCGEMR